jgi:signal transduction histidine kinase
MTYGNPMLDDKGNVMMWVGANIDIQERKVSEEYLIASHQGAHGSGLGLYIVKEIIEKLKGKIKVTSKFGVGTTFLIKLPQINEEKRG